MGSPGVPEGSEDLRPGDPRRIGDYQLIARLGEGGMGTVFLGRSPGGRLAAVKVVREELVRKPEFRDRFKREVKAARKVSGAFTAPVIDADADAPSPWLATSYIPGPSLEQAVSGHGPLPARTVRALGSGLAEALAAIHEEGVVHRDLKPSNVLLAADGPRVIDFGIARAAVDSTITRTGYVLGSPGFISPEQVISGEADSRSDVFALGGVLAYAATGQGPFGDAPVHTLLYRVVNEEPRLDGIADAGLRALAAECLSKDPASRPGPRQVITRIAASGDVRLGDGWLPGGLAGPAAPPDAGQPPGGASPGPQPGERPQPPPKQRFTPEPQGHVIIVRESAAPLSARLFTVLIDGQMRGLVAAGATARFSVARGSHTVQIKAGEFSSTRRTVDVVEACTMMTRPKGGLGQPITGLELSLTSRPAAASPVPAKAGTGTVAKKNTGGGAGVLLVVAALFGLLYWQNTGFADYVTDTWHWAGNPWTSASSGECLHYAAQSTSQYGPMVEVPCFSAAANYTLDGVEPLQSGETAAYYCPSSTDTYVLGGPYGHPSEVLCASPRQ